MRFIEILWPVHLCKLVILLSQSLFKHLHLLLLRKITNYTLYIYIYSLKFYERGIYSLNRYITNIV